MFNGPPRRAFAGTRRFEILRELGAGGMGVVYEAFDRERETHVALKTLLTLDGEARLRLKAEFRSLQDLTHPNLVALGELLEGEGHLFFTMELVRGIDFLEHVRPRPSASLPAPPPTPSSLVAVRDNATLDTNCVVPTQVLARPALGTTFDEARLRSAFTQLAQGLCALHAAQKVHRDIKPSNVLVTDEGRVIILDFGVVADLSHRVEAGEKRRVVGTSDYMAPEQAAAKAIGPEADWYSAGVMLYRALAGAFPFELAPEAVIAWKQRAEPPPPSHLVPDLPPDLEALCVNLLRRDPAARPSGRQVLAWMGVRVEDEPTPLLASDFVGRRRELVALQEAFTEAQRSPVAVLIEGESGVGKSALLRCFLDRIRGRALVLAGRCYERESVPFKAIDEVAERLARFLSALPDTDATALLPPDIDLLVSVFPALRRAPAVAQVVQAVHRPPLMGVRARVFRALREILRRIAARSPLVVAIDDLQWADLDSMALLAEILRTAYAPLLLLVATVRTVPQTRSLAPSCRLADLLFEGTAAGTGASADDLASRFLLPPRAVRRIPLTSLSSSEAQALAAALLRRAAREARTPRGHHDHSSAAAGSIRRHAADLADESGGMPFFIDALVRYRSAHPDDDEKVRLDEVLSATVARLDASARCVVEMVAVAGRPLLLDAAARGSGLDGEELGRVIVILQALHLVRAGGSGREAFVEPFHDRVRDAVQGRLEPEERRAWHGRVATALEASGRADLGALAGHWYEAGDTDRAAEYAVRAGDRAREALAFDRAAHLYRAALAIAPHEGAESHGLRIKLADALGDAGFGTEAADAYLSAVHGASTDEGIDLERRAAENLLRTGHIDEGLGGLHKVLARLAVQVPTSPRAVMASLHDHLRRAAERGLEWNRDGDPSPRMRIEIDAYWSASIGLGMVNPLRAADFLARCMLLSLEGGDAHRVARALALAAVFSAAGGRPRDRLLAADLLHAAEGVALRTGLPHAIALLQTVRGTLLYNAGRFRAALGAMDEAEVIFREECAGVSWERASVIAFSLSCLWFLGELAELARRAPQHVREADERGDRYFASGLRSGIANVFWLVDDDPGEARRETQAVMATWSTQGFHLQHFFHLLADGQVDLYEGDGPSAYRKLIARWPALSSSQLLHVHSVRLPALHLRARACLAFAEADGTSDADRARLVRAAERMAARIHREETQVAGPLAAMILAGAAVLRGDTVSGRLRIDEAVRGFAVAEMALFELVARRRSAEIRGKNPGAQDRAMADLGVRNPSRMAAMLAPGFSRLTGPGARNP